MTRIEIRLPEEAAALIDRDAQYKGLTRNEYVKNAVYSHMAKYATSAVRKAWERLHRVEVPEGQGK
jgi:uncharacterized protein (DUF1778 family)